MKFSRSVIVKKLSEASIIARSGVVGFSGLPFPRKWSKAQGPQPSISDPKTAFLRDRGISLNSFWNIIKKRR